MPDWIDAPLSGESARLITFRRILNCDSSHPSAVIRVSADTRYKLLVNDQRVTVGPSRGSDKFWFYDTIDLAPWLQAGENVIIIKVLRFFPSADAGFSFARTSFPGLAVVGSVGTQDISTGGSGSSWEGRAEPHVFFPSKSDVDIFLHVSLVRIIVLTYRYSSILDVIVEIEGGPNW